MVLDMENRHTGILDISGREIIRMDVAGNSSGGNLHNSGKMSYGLPECVKGRLVLQIAYMLA